MTLSTLNGYEKELKNPSGKRWFCQPCEPKSDYVKRPSIGPTETPKKHDKEYTLHDVMEKLEELNGKYASLLQKYEEQLTENEHLKSEIKQLSKRVENIEQHCPENKSVEALQEMHERNYKKKNLIIFGIKEMNSDEPEQRKAHDTSTVQSIFQSTCPEVQVNQLKVYRLGKHEQGKMRPVKVIMSSEDEVKQIMIKGKDIRKNTHYAKLAFSSDKTKKQLAEYKLIKEEMKRRSEAGEENLRIKYIRGEPKIMKLKN